jgi:hypothetical protein|tara:strand:+ start:29521 stop:30198 length:678 start_codon:yes stop_codon:yes gene_type:complete
MKVLLLLTALLGCTISLGQTVPDSLSVKKYWEPILKESKLATYFSGMWESLGITIEETGEKITVLHQKDHFDLVNGVNEDGVDYSITIKLFDVRNMASHGQDGGINADESFKIMKTLFTPFVQASLKHPMMNKSGQMRLAGIENHVHVYLRGPNEGQVATHTMIFINKRWVVMEGIHGDAKRVFNMTVDQAIEYQKAAFDAKKKDTRKSWKKYKLWYLKWRKTVS